MLWIATDGIIAAHKRTTEKRQSEKEKASEGKGESDYVSERVSSGMI